MSSDPRARVAFGFGLRLIYALVLGGFSVEILIRRVAGNQIPTQLPTALVYGVILLNGFLIWRLFRRSESSKKTGKN